jgi:hypothetical protein
MEGTTISFPPHFVIPRSEGDEESGFGRAKHPDPTLRSG